MAENVILNPLTRGSKALKAAAFDSTLTALFLDVAATGAASASFSTAASAASPLTGTMDNIRLKTPITSGYSLAGASFGVGADRYVSKANGEIQRNPSATTGIGSTVGAMVPATGEITLAAWPAGASCDVSNWRAMAGAPVNGADTPYSTYTSTFRIATAPIRPGSFSVQGQLQDGTAFNYTADTDGFINQAYIKGAINYQTGVVQLVGVTATAGGVAEKVDLSFLGIAGVASEYLALIRQETLRYNAVAFTYLPLNADLLGIDAVRLPSDGRVPIFRAGGLAVLGEAKTTAPTNVSNGQTIDCVQVRLSRVRVLGSNNQAIAAGYTEDLEAGTVTFTDVTGYAQPVRVEYTWEDMGLVSDVQIDGSVTFTRRLTHNYSTAARLSSCLRTGDLKSRVSLVFDQATWNGTEFIDSVSGAVAPGTYNSASFPITVTNVGAITERWGLLFRTTGTVDVIGEHIGNVGNFPIANTIAPVNPITGQPYFSINPAGWGVGWANGNGVRINTVGAMYPVWMVRTVQQGPEAAADYSFLSVVRGDVDNPLI